MFRPPFGIPKRVAKLVNDGRLRPNKQKIVQLRKERSWSQRDLIAEAERVLQGIETGSPKDVRKREELGDLFATPITLRTLQNIEAGKRCYLSTLQTLAVLFDRPIEELVPTDGAPIAPDAYSRRSKGIPAVSLVRDALWLNETAEFNKAILEQGGDECRLLIAAAFCDPHSFSWPFVLRITDMKREQGETARTRLAVAKLLEPARTVWRRIDLECQDRRLDQDRQRFRLPSVVRQLMRAKTIRTDLVQRAHAEALECIFREWEIGPKKSLECIECLPEVPLAVRFLWESSYPARERALRLGHWGYRCAYLAGEHELALRIEKQNAQLGRRRTDKLSLYMLQRSYGNQASIEYERGQLKHALLLFKKKAKLCKKLTNDGGLQADELQASLGNQATIFKDWGRFSTAMTLLECQEKLCRKTGTGHCNKNGLQACYGNQALLLEAQARKFDAQGRLTEAEEYRARALDCLVTQEKICEELNDENNLQLCKGNQAWMLITKGGKAQLRKAKKLLDFQERLCKKIGNVDSLQVCYGNRAEIKLIEAKYEDARLLLWKQQAIIRKLRKPLAMAHFYWKWAKLASLESNDAKRRRKLEKVLAIFRKLKMPLEIDALEAELKTA